MRMAGQPSMTSTPGAWWRGPLVVVAAILGLIVMLSPDASITTRSTTAVAATTPTRTVTYGYDGAHQQPPARPSEARFRIRGGTRLASLAVHSVGQVRPASVSVLAAEEATGVIKGTNARGLVNSRGSFRKPPLQNAWDNAEVGPTGGRLCPTCGVEVSVPPGTGVPRDWHGSHFPSWSNREFPSTIERPEILDNYNEGVSLECPVCNMRGGNDDARFGP